MFLTGDTPVPLTFAFIGIVKDNICSIARVNYLYFDLGLEKLDQAVRTAANRSIVAGSPSAVDTGTLKVDGITIPLAGVEGIGGVIAESFDTFLTEQGSHVTCKRLDPTGFKCVTKPGVDLSEAVILNGGAKAAPDASERLKTLESRAREEKRGIWQ